MQYDSMSDVASRILKQRDNNITSKCIDCVDPLSNRSQMKVNENITGQETSSVSSQHFDQTDINKMAMNDNKWHVLSRRLRNMVAAKNAIVEPAMTKKLAIEQKDTFLERFSTRDTSYSQNSRPIPGVSRATKNNGRIPLNSFYIGNKSPRPENSTKCVLQLDVVPRQDNNTPLSTVSEEISNNVATKVGFVKDNFKDKLWYNYFDIAWNWIIEPYSTFAYIWHYFLIVAIHYNCWALPLRLAFTSTQEEFVYGWLCFDYIFDFIYLLDIFICTRTSYLLNGIYVDEKKLMFSKYAKSLYFVLDIIALLPYDIFYAWRGISPIWRLPRLIKLYKIIKAKLIIESVTTFTNVVRALFLVHLVFLLIHWNACFYFMISKREGFGNNTWVYPMLNGIHSQTHHQYVHCLYWSTLALTTIGESNGPVTTESNIYMIVCYITGVFIFATIVGQAGSVIQNMNSSRMDFERQRDNTMIYMKDHRVPSDMQRRVRLWYDYTYSRGRFQGGADINDVILLPNKMKTELALHVHLETLRRVTFLQKCPPEFLHDLVLKMKMHIFTPGDYICKKGEVAREMYVVSDGILEVLSENQNILKVLYPGDFFGEIGILSLSEGQNRRTADVRSCGYVELFVLSKEDVLSATVDYPQAQKILAKHGRRRLMKDGKNKSGLRDATSSESEPEVIEDKNDEKKKTAEMSKNRNSVDRAYPYMKVSDLHKKRIVNWHASVKSVNMNEKRFNKSDELKTLHIGTGIRSAMVSFVSPALPIEVKENNSNLDSETSAHNEELSATVSPDFEEFQRLEYNLTRSNKANIKTPDTHDHLFDEIFEQAHSEAIKSLKSYFKRKLKKEIVSIRMQLREQNEVNNAQKKEIEELKLNCSCTKVKSKTRGIGLSDREMQTELQKKKIRIQELEASIKTIKTKSHNKMDVTDSS